MAGKALISSLPFELSLFPELRVLTVSAVSRMGHAQWLLAFTSISIGSTGDTTVPENAPIS